MSCPGGATVELGRTLLNQPNAGYQRADAPNAYPVTVAGVRGLLRQRVGAQVAALPFVTATSSSAGTAVLAAAVRVHGVCDFVRLVTSTTVSSWVDFWPAPVDDQSTCDATRALAAATLYGADPAQEG